VAAHLAFSAALCLGGEILDRVVATVGTVAITASDVEREYRFERFLDGQWPASAPDAATLDRVRERLTYQVLLGHEDDPAAGDQPEAKKAAEERLGAIRKGFASDEDFREALHAMGLTEAQVIARMVEQDRMMRLIDQRLRPAASPSDDTVTDYYRQTFVPGYQKKNGGAAAPPFPEVEGLIREILTQKRINELLDQWIEELKPTSRVRFHSF
jgi:hypothetical protein